MRDAVRRPPAPAPPGIRRPSTGTRAATRPRGAAPRRPRRRRPRTRRDSGPSSASAGVADPVDAAVSGQSPSGRPPLSSRSSHSLASFQSRFTVSGDTFSASAVSSTLSPPKNRSSTTWARRSERRGEVRQRLVQRDQVLAALLRHDQRLVERHARGAATALLIALRARGVHEDAPHQPRRHREEVRAVLPAHVPEVHQPQVGLVDERRRPAACARRARGPCSGAPAGAARRGPAESAARARPHPRRPRPGAVLSPGGSPPISGVAPLFSSGSGHSTPGRPPTLPFPPPVPASGNEALTARFQEATNMAFSERTVLAGTMAVALWLGSPAGRGPRRAAANAHRRLRPCAGAARCAGTGKDGRVQGFWRDRRRCRMDGGSPSSRARCRARMRRDRRSSTPSSRSA